LFGLRGYGFWLLPDHLSAFLVIGEVINRPQLLARRVPVADDATTQEREVKDEGVDHLAQERFEWARW
jgi:hypothetical protein